MEQSKLRLGDNQLRQGIKDMRAEGKGKLEIVKWVWDHCDRGLKDSKMFVDESL